MSAPQPTLRSLAAFKQGTSRDRYTSSGRWRSTAQDFVDIDRALQSIMDEAVAKKAELVEIIPGKGSGALKKHVLRYLDRKDVRALHHRVEKDSDNWGRIFVHFRWK